MADGRVIHGHCTRRQGETRTYRIWKGMITRCRNPKSPHFFKYGARGISVCARWRDYRNFLADMGEAPPSLSIDRIDNSGNYEPINCRWATVLEQMKNKRGNHFLTIDGRTQIIAEWAREAGVSSGLIKDRLLKLRWPPKDAVFGPRIKPGYTRKSLARSTDGGVTPP